VISYGLPFELILNKITNQLLNGNIYTLYFMILSCFTLIDMLIFKA